MRLYVKNSSGQVVYLNLVTSTRAELARRIGGANFYLNHELFSVNDVRATGSNAAKATGAVVGGLVGAIGGPAGVAIGAALGGLIGHGSDESENEKIRRFNRS